MEISSQVIILYNYPHYGREILFAQNLVGSKGCGLLAVVRSTALNNPSLGEGEVEQIRKNCPLFCKLLSSSIRMGFMNNRPKIMF